MNDELLLGFALASVGVAMLATGVLWLAAGAFVAAIPFLAIGVLLTLARRPDGPPADAVD
jgi:hypothetical protein